MATVKSLEERLDDFEAHVREQFEGLRQALVSQASHQERFESLLREFVEAQRKFAEAQTNLAAELKASAHTQATTQAQLATITNSAGVQQVQLAEASLQFKHLRDDLARTESGLSATVARMDSPENGLAALGAKQTTTTTEVREVSTKVTEHRVDFSAFRGKVEATLGLAKWVGGLATVTLISVILTGFSVALSAGGLKSAVEQQQKTLEEG